jgi:hypothetical protein
MMDRIPKSVLAFLSQASIVWRCLARRFLPHPRSWSTPYWCLISHRNMPLPIPLAI